ncbi:unnamed protein product [Dovyalis caffra]|uniref:Uncharacterized protein n=1 Tax=Dovyalis caffra TaxID=77055 RepID=A0AAV1RI49_9ROSI|nr:unnamed protein product [Dovyalis caffra]
MNYRICKGIAVDLQAYLDNYLSALSFMDSKNIIQQLPPSQDSVQLQGQRPTLYASVPQNELGNQKQQSTLQSKLQLLEVNMKHQRRRMRDYLQRRDLPSMHPFNANDNGIAYWRRNGGVCLHLIVLDFMPLVCSPRQICPFWINGVEYGKAVHETVYGQLHVVREGKIRIIFAHNLKVSYSPLHEAGGFYNTLSYILGVLFRYFAGNFVQGTMKSCCLKVQFYLRLLSAGCKLERNLDLQLVDDLGFSIRSVGCFQIADRFNCMKDLMTFSWDNKVGPIGLPTDPNKLPTSHVLGANNNDDLNMSKVGLLNGADVVRHCIFPRQSCFNSNVGELKQPSLLCKRCERSVSSTPSQGPKTLSTELNQKWAFPSLLSSGGSQHRPEDAVHSKD